jgi:hypothetical protein
VNRAAALVALALLSSASPAAAHELDYGDWKLDFNSTLTELVTINRELRVRFPDPNDPNAVAASQEAGSLLSTTRLRFELQARYGDHWSGQLVYDNEFFLGTGRQSFAFQAAKELGAPTFLDLDQTIVDSGDLTWRHLLYRGWVKFANDDLEVVLGRQRIALGRAQLWNPTDIFNLIPPLAVEADQRVGVDSLLARVKLSDGLWAAAIISPERHDHHPRSALRLELSQRQVDVALMVAKIDRDYLLGGDFATNLGDAALRGELTETWYQGVGNPKLQAVLSLDYTIPIGAGLYALVEHFYNQNVVERRTASAALSAPGLTPDSGLRLFAASRAPQLVTFARNQTGVSFGYDLTPLLRGNFLCLYDWNGASEAFVPSLTWSPRDDLELSAGVQMFRGSKTGQFGGLPTLWILRADVFF